MQGLVHCYFYFVVVRLHKRRFREYIVFDVQRQLLELRDGGRSYHIEVRQQVLHKEEVLGVVYTLKDARDRSQGDLVEPLYFVWIEYFWCQQLMDQMSVRQHYTWNLVVAAEVAVLFAVYLIHDQVVLLGNLGQRVNCLLHILPSVE